MGCDIHMLAERRRRDREPARAQNDPLYEDEQDWVVIKGEFKNPYYAPNPDHDFQEPKKRTTPYSDRNYELFAFLADVRNGTGFAGTDTGDKIIPLAEPRGVPVNASVDWKAENYDWGGDMHSQSWFTLEELLKTNWGQMVTRRGYVTPEQFKVFERKGKPEEWSGDVIGGRIKKISNQEMAQLKVGKGDFNSYYTQVEWRTPMSVEAGSFLTETIPALKAVAKKYKVGNEDIRIVFGFDN